MDINIRKAESFESDILTSISFKSKHYWNYPEEYFDVWKDELTITSDYIKKNRVYVAERNNNEVLGYYSIVENPEDFWAGKVFVMKGFWLEHIFIVPEYIGFGIGRKLFRHALGVCMDIGCDKLYIFSDPYSRGFYEKIGAEYIKESPSSIEGRTIPLFELKICR